MKLSIFLFLSLIILPSCVEEEFPIEKNVIVLTEFTFDKALEKYENILVMFYSPLCNPCILFTSEYEKIADELREENIIVAKVNVFLETKLSQKYQVTGYPSFKFFKKGNAINYNGARIRKAIINWVRENSASHTKSLKTVDDVEIFKIKNEVCAIYFGNDTEEIKVFEGSALIMEDIPFGIVEDEEVAKKNNAKPKSVVLFKKFDKERYDLETVKKNELNFFLEKYSQIRIRAFDYKTIERVLGKNQSALIFFGEKGDKWNKVKKILEKIADKFIGKLLFVMSEIKEDMEKRIAEFIGVKNKDIPSVRILDTRQDIKKYIMKGKINEKNILNFIDGWEQGKLKLHLKTQEEPKDNNGDIFEVVGKTFQKEVIENDKDVMILFYAPWSKHYKQLLSKYTEAAKILKAKNPKIILAEMDGTENDVESMTIIAFPTIKFYPGNKKDSKPIDFDGDKTTEGILKFIKTYAYNKIVLDEEKEEEKKDGKNFDL